MADHGADAGNPGAAEAGISRTGPSVGAPSGDVDAGQQTGIDRQTDAAQLTKDGGSADPSAPPAKLLDCQPGVKRCDPSAKLTPQTCDDTGVWRSGMACANLCSSGSCSGACSPGAKHCGANNVPELCDEQGTWQPTVACASVCSGAGDCTGECKPGAQDCGPLGPKPGLPATPRLCGDDGRWKSLPTCDGQSCANGSCIGECVAGQLHCSASGAAQTCGASGHWVDGGAIACAKPNLALGATVIYSTSLNYAVFSAPGLVDGDVNTSYSSDLETSPEGSRMTKDPLCADWVGVQMSKNVTFSTVVLIPRSDGVNYPQSFSIDLWDGEKWIPRLTVNPPNGGLYQPTAPLPYSWGHSDTTTRVRICTTALAREGDSYVMQIAELQLLP